MPFPLFQGSWRSELEEPEVFDLCPDVSLADENDEHEETSQHVAAVDDPEEDFNRL